MPPITYRTAQQLSPKGIGLHKHGGKDFVAFSQKLAEIRKEIGQLQAALVRLEQAHLRDPQRFNWTPMLTGRARSVSPATEDGIVAVHGWVLSLVESAITLVWIEDGAEDSDLLMKQWKNYFP